MRKWRHEAAKSQRKREKRSRARRRGVEPEIAWDLSTVQARRAYITSHLKECADCGITDHRLLTFHHLDPSEKRYNVKAMIFPRFPKQVIDDEIRKCAVLCFNCHRLRHWKG